MNTIQRYELVEHSRGMETYHVMDWMDDGDWVKFEDHERIVKELQSEIDRLNELYSTDDADTPGESVDRPTPQYEAFSIEELFSRYPPVKH